MAANPWEFGWTQLLAIAGLALTAAIAVGGFRTFGRWKREKLEEKRIEIGLEALSIAYESKIVFDSIRVPLSYEFEYKDMPMRSGEPDNERQERGSYWAVGKRINQNQDFFIRVWKLQPKVMAMFGEEAEVVFKHLHQARALIQASSKALVWDLPIPPIVRNQEDLNLRGQLRDDLWGSGEPNDRVQLSLASFRQGIERMCKPVVDREFREL